MQLLKTSNSLENFTFLPSVTRNVEKDKEFLNQIIKVGNVNLTQRTVDQPNKNHDTYKVP